jgi:peptidoglycan/LPS O-acetylase OafA/YrhL
MQTTDRLHSLDALRGIAALAVVFWHWQHFFYAGDKLMPDFTSAGQPLFDVFFLLYRNGAMAVDLFFSLSGFIFFWLYADSIANQKISAKTFFILRFSRLYPLHIVTLLVVALGQFIYGSMHHTDFVYPWNDVRHFILNLFLLPSVGLESGYSYNGPIWSVSVEVVLYVLFYTLCRFNWVRVPCLLALSALGFIAMAAHAYPPVSRGLASFFLGACTLHAFSILSRHNHRAVIAMVLGGATAALWLVCLWVSWRGLPSFIPSKLHNPLLFLFPIIVLFPMTILSLALLEVNRGGLGRRLSFLGDISYSSYLWHFPLQLAWALVAFELGAAPGFFLSPWVLLVFFLNLIAVSLVSYHSLEMPAQRRIRAAFLPQQSRLAMPV